jgi:hypothetical protein
MFDYFRSLIGTVRPSSGGARPGPRVLNVGGNDKRIPIPPHYLGWDHVLLDIDANVHPDIVCDARQLTLLPAAEFDAVYCSHNFEHYYPHDGRKVLRGFLHVLRSDHKTGFTPRSLYRILKDAGFGDVFVSVAVETFDLRAFAFKGSATLQQRTVLELPDEPS